MIESEIKKLLTGCYYSFIVLGMVVLAIGPILPQLSLDLGLNNAQGGTLVLILSMVSLLSSTLSGYISDRTGRKPVIISGSIFFIIGFSALIFVNSIWVLYLTMCIIGIGWGIFNFGINAVVNDVTLGDGRT